MKQDIALIFKHHEGRGTKGSRISIYYPLHNKRVFADWNFEFTGLENQAKIWLIDTSGLRGLVGGISYATIDVDSICVFVDLSWVAEIDKAMKIKAERN